MAKPDRFGVLYGYDDARKPRLPAELRDKNPDGKMWRRIDGEWTRRPCPGRPRRLVFG